MRRGAAALLGALVVFQQACAAPLVALNKTLYGSCQAEPDYSDVLTPPGYVSNSAASVVSDENTRAALNRSLFRIGFFNIDPPGAF